ncbi:hypothetical protein CK203_115585 [Vitis vinifera]|uniref:Uncharacterized protein n=1 Tax=Vitis vinifera TaxID=29760 RepID=A0A438EA72_VITVI|nr:hypothetical protein CK203_115585 [Vitis vinifera]
MVPPLLLDVSHYYSCGLERDSTWVARFGRPPAPPTAQHLEHDAADDLLDEQLDTDYRMRHCYTRVYQLIR